MTFKLFQEYWDNSTFHGIKYIGKQNICIPERVFWFFATLLLIGFTSTVALGLWHTFLSKPIEIVVETTNYPLADIPFPAVTICPKNPINVTAAVKYLSRYISGPIKLKYSVLKKILAILDLLKFPSYTEIKGYLQLSRKYLKNFDSLIITDFMLAVLPKCNELLNECFWHGTKLNCCEIFTLQRTEEGFCYSFNSLTSENNKMCSINTFKNESSRNEPEPNCTPRFLTFSGIYSGLTVFAKYQENIKKFFLPYQKHVSGIIVTLGPPYEFPKPGEGTLLHTIPGASVQIEVSASMLHNTRKISRISKNDRECIFNFESDLFTKYYSQHSCFIACRQEFLMRMCGCQLYFFYDPEIFPGPICKVSQLFCVVKYANALKMKSPSKYAFYKPFIKDFPDCNCQPACEVIWYDLAIKRKNVSELIGRNNTGHLDIFYSKYGAIKYKRRLTFSSENLIVHSMHSSRFNNKDSHQGQTRNHKISLVEKKYDREYKKAKTISLLKEFTQTSTIHGVQHIFREGETPLHRLIWTVFFTICLSGATYLMYDSWSGYITVPIVISVVDTNYPLDGVYFPAVSVCPAEKIVKAKAMEYLAKKVDNDTFNDVRIEYFLKALTALQHPLYHRLSFYLNKSNELLKSLEYVNITELMIKSLPSCKEIFLECYWQGHTKNCCSVFFLQRSEEGFCYSFNSFTSEKNKHCIYKDKNIDAKRCKLLTTSSTGQKSGIEILIKSFKSLHSSSVYSNSKALIQVHHPNEYPEPGLGSLVPIGDLDKMNIGIKPTITESSDDIRKLSSKISGCHFKDTKKSLVTRIYSQKSCLLECRMLYIIEKCGCLPYYITMKHFTKICNATELLCIVSQTDELRFYRPPSASSKISEYVKITSLDCTHCLPTCNERQYEIVIDLTEDISSRKHKYDGYVDIFYKYSGAVRYQRDMSYDFIQLLVNLGAIGGLFLGGSLLSLLETLYWLSKAFLIYIWPIKNKGQKKRVRVNETITNNQGWIN